MISSKRWNQLAKSLLDKTKEIEPPPPTDKEKINAPQE